jgi:predicted Zn-dependent protease with MMP-like domain
MTGSMRHFDESSDRDEDAVVQVVGETVIQKHGHYFGLSKEEIESRYWRG